MPRHDIAIDPKDPFANDLLNREETIRAQTAKLLAKHPQVIAIDAGWGQGKSVFMKLWAAHLRLQNVKVIQFNAWHHSTSDPTYAMTAGILNVLQDQADGLGAAAYRRLRKFLKDHQAKIQAGITVIGLLPKGSSIANWHKVLLDLISGNKIVEFPEDFCKALSELAEHQVNPPLVILVDELDRCSPDYAVKMLQTLEHVFSTSGIVFAVAINHDQLTHSVKRFYGDQFDANAYLERFFDGIYQLPSTQRVQFIELSLKNTLRGVKYAHEETTEKGRIGYSGQLREAYQAERVIIEQHIRGILHYLNDSDLSIRQIKKAMIQLEDILADDLITPHIQHISILIWLLRSLYPIEYAQFSRGDITEKAFSDFIYQQPVFQEYRKDTHSDRRTTSIWIEAILIHLSLEKERNRFPSYPMPQSSPLMVFHNTNRSAADETEVPPEYSKEVLDLFEGRAPFRPGIELDAPAQAASLLERIALPSEGNHVLDDPSYRDSC